MSRLRFLLPCLLVLAGLLPVAGPARPAFAGTIQVTTTNDEFNLIANGTCSLREAIRSANLGSDFGGCTGAAAGANTIVLSAATYSLGTRDNAQYGFNGTPAIYTQITIEGHGATIQRGGAASSFRLFHVAASGDFIPALNGPAPSGGNLLLHEVTLSNGLAQGGQGGAGGILNGGGGGGGGGFGGAIYVRGSLTLDGVTLTGNMARGGDGGAGGTNSSPPTANGGGGGGGMGGNGGRGPAAGEPGNRGSGGGGGMGGNGGNSGSEGGAGGGGMGVGADGGNTTGDGGGGGGGRDDAPTGVGGSTTTATGGAGAPGGGDGGPSAPSPFDPGGYNGAPGSDGGGGGGGLTPNGGGGGGGFGGGGGGSPFSNRNGGNGGVGGGGGGNSGGGGSGGGDGGFGGGGGGSLFVLEGGGGGGFGGGGGGGASGGNPTVGGPGGFGAGNGGGSGGPGGPGGGGGAGLGGAIFVDASGTLVSRNATFSANAAVGGTGGTGGVASIVGANGEGRGGAIFTRNGSVTLSNVTVNANTAAQGAAVEALGDGAGQTATLILQRTIVANSSASPDCRTLTIAGGSTSTPGSTDNLVETNSGCAGIVSSAAPNLAGLAPNGGLTQTHALNPGSPALDAVVGTCPPEATDQRGRSRPQDGDNNGVATCDIGAYERAPGALQFSAPTYSVNESGGTVTISVTRTDGTEGAVGATATLGGGASTATPGTDYTGTTFQVSFADGDAATKTFAVPIVNDGNDEPDETVLLTLGSPTGGAAIGAQATSVLTIVDDDPSPPVVTTTGSSLAYTENQGAVAIDPGLTVTDADSASLASATVKITTGYQEGADVLACPACAGFVITAAFNAGTGQLDLSGTVAVASYQAALRSVTYQNTSDTPGTSRTVSFQVADAPGNLASNVAIRQVAVIAVNDAPLGAPDTFDVLANTPTTIAAPGVLANDVDPDGPGLSAVLVANAQHGTVVLQANGGFTYTPIPQQIGPDSFTYKPNDGALDGNVVTVNLVVGGSVLSIDDVRVAEGDAGTKTATFTVTLRPPSARQVTVQVQTQDDSAQAGSDYVAVPLTTLTFAPGDTSKQVNVTINGDTVHEPNELFRVLLTNPVGALLVRLQGIGTIVDDDPATPRVQVQVQPATSNGVVVPGRLQVTVTADTKACTASNTLQRIDVGAARNARVEIPGAAPGTPGGPSPTPGGPNGTPGNFSVAVNAVTATFIVQRQAAGDFKVDHSIVDGCNPASNPFRSFVGGGAGVP